MAAQCPSGPQSGAAHFLTPCRVRAAPSLQENVCFVSMGACGLYTTSIHLDRFTEVQNSWPVGEILFITSTLQPVPTHPPMADHALRLSTKRFSNLSYLQVNTRTHLPVLLCLFNGNFLKFSFLLTLLGSALIENPAEDFFLCSLPDPGCTG